MIAEMIVMHRWCCPNCTFTDVTFEPRSHSRFHSCRGLLGVSAPMVLEGTKCKVELIRRGDYVNGDMVQLDGEGKPIQSVITTRDDGYDCAVFAPAATIDSEVQKQFSDFIKRKTRRLWMND